MTITMTSSWRFQDDSGACACCDPTFAMEGGMWYCQNQHCQWIVLQPYTEGMKHSANECKGNCTTHPLLQGSVLRYQNAMHRGHSWGDMAYREELASLERMTEAEREKHERATSQRMEELELSVEASKRARYTEKMAELTKKTGQKKQPSPCKWVIGEHKGEECWAYEYTEPKSKQFVEEKTGKPLKAEVTALVKAGKARIVRVGGSFVLQRTPHTCNRVHPGEEGWHDEWYKDPYFGAPRFQNLKRK